MKAIINMTTAFLLLLLFLFGFSLVTYNSNPEKYQWLELNAKGELVGFKDGNYNITVSYNLDTPLDDLNGNSLNDVFLNTSETDLQYLINAEPHKYSLTEVNGVKRATVTISYTPLVLVRHSNFQGQIGDVYWSFAKVNRNYTTTSTNLRVSFQYYSSGFSKIVGAYNGLTEYYGNHTVASGDFNYRIYMLGDAYLGDYVEYLEWKTINLTDLGISDLTEDEMYYWYNEYKKLQENKIENYKELGSTVESSWVFLTNYFTTFVDIIDTQVDLILNPLEVLEDGLSIITVPIFGLFN